MRFPIGWMVGKNQPCSICMRESVESGREEFYGCVGSQECIECHRKVCELHFNSTQQKCLDCFIYVNPKETKSTHTNSST